VVATPGLVCDFVFGDTDDVPTTSLKAYFKAYYDGTLTHNVKLQQWNYDSGAWENVTVYITDFPGSVAEQVYQFTLLHDSDYISQGEIKLRIVSSSLGNLAHSFHINELYLEIIAGEIRKIRTIVSHSMLITTQVQ
jgi:hypothetical protein